MRKLGTKFIAGDLIVQTQVCMYCMFIESRCCQGVLLGVFLHHARVCLSLVNLHDGVFQEDLARPGAPGQGARPGGAPAAARP